MNVDSTQLSSAPERFFFISDIEATEFLDTLRRRAKMLRAELDERGAALLEKHAAEVEAFLFSWQDECVSVRDAAAATGYSEDHIRRQIRSGALANHGAKHKPRVRRGDLRPKRTRHVAAQDTTAYDVNADIRSLQIRRGE